MPLALWQMLDADGWCLMMVLYMVLSDILAERRMARRTQVRWKGCFTFTGASLADSGLLQSWFVSVVAVHVIFPFVLYLGKNWGTQARRWRRRGERQHAYEQTKKNMPQKMTATCHTRPKASHHKYKAAGINERQQEHKEPGAKILMNIEARTAGWRSSLSNGAGWISSLSNGAHWRKPNKRRRGPGAETSLQQPQHHSHSRRKLTLSNVLMLFLCWGCVRDTLARRMPYEMLVPRCKGILQRVNCHFIRALCAPSVSPCGSCGTVMDGHGHLHTVLSFPKNFVEGPLHGACLWVTPPWVATSWFVSVSLARCASFRCVL